MDVRALNFFRAKRVVYLVVGDIVFTPGCEDLRVVIHRESVNMTPFGCDEPWITIRFHNGTFYRSWTDDNNYVDVV